MSTTPALESAVDSEVFTQLPLAAQLYDANGELIATNPAFLALLEVGCATRLVRGSLFADPLLETADRSALRSGHRVTRVAPLAMRC